MGLNKLNKICGMNNRIYSIPSKDSLMGDTPEPDELKRDDIEHKFVNRISEIVCELFDVSYNDRRLMQPLLKKSLHETLDNRGGRNSNPGMLQQYLAHELEEIGQNMRRELIIPNEIRVNHDNHPHMVFRDLINYIQENYVRKDDIKSDGTFDTIIEKRRELDSSNCNQACGCDEIGCTNDHADCESAG